MRPARARCRISAVQHHPQSHGERDAGRDGQISNRTVDQMPVEGDVPRQLDAHSRVIPIRGGHRNQTHLLDGFG